MHSLTDRQTDANTSIILQQWQRHKNHPSSVSNKARRRNTTPKITGFDDFRTLSQNVLTMVAQHQKVQLQQLPKVTMDITRNTALSAMTRETRSVRQYTESATERHHHHFILPKNKNIIINNTTEIQLEGRQKNKVHEAGTVLNY